MRKEDETYLDAIKERLTTVKGAQEVIDETLAEAQQLMSRSNRSGESLDDFETVPDDLYSVLRRLGLAFISLPSEVASLSVGFRFAKVQGVPKTAREYELKNLQLLLEQIGINSSEGESVQGEIVVLPPFVPEELKSMSHGSASRSLAHEVRETLRVTRSSVLNVLEVKPHGAPGGEAGIWAMDAMNYRVPLAQVEYLRLDTEPKPLTPWLEMVGGHELAVREVRRD